MKGSFFKQRRFLDREDLERQLGEWRTEGNMVRQYVNGKLVNEGTDPFPKEGKILIQSEGAEVYFRNITLYPLQ